MFRRLVSLGVPLLLFSLMSAPTAGALVGDTLRSGYVLDSGGNPVVGASVAVYEDVLPAMGRSAKPRLLASAVTDKAGYYELSLPLTDDLLAKSAANGGAVNFYFAVVGGSRLYSDMFFAETGDSSGLLAPSHTWTTGPARKTVRLAASTPGVSPLPRSQPLDADAPVPCPPQVTTLDTVDRFGTIGELHTPNDTDRARFVYGESADSDIGVGFSDSSNGPWSVSGSIHIGNSRGASVTLTRFSNFGHRVESEFKVYKQKWVQCVSVHYRVQSGPWLGSIREGADIRQYDNQCSTYPSINVATHDANSSFHRISREYVTFFGALGAYGAELTAQSGASTYVEAHWEFGPSQTAKHALCGNNDAPPYAKRIFAGM